MWEVTDQKKPLTSDERIRQAAKQKVSEEEFARRLEVAREVMRKYSNSLRKLAERDSDSIDK